MKNIIAYRIKNARILKGFTLQNLADELLVSKQMINKYEKGKSIPDSKKIIKLAKLLDQKVDYFFRSFLVDVGHVDFRKKSKFSIKKQKALKEQIKINLENYLWIEDLLSIDYSFKNVISDHQVVNISEIEQAIIQLRMKWDIGNDPIYNIIQLLEDKEIKVIELFDVDDKFDGLATFVNDKYPVIVVNGNFPVERKRFTLLHELGHLLLNMKGVDSKQEEILCNQFASEFLLPRKFLLNEFGGKRGHITIQEFISIQEKYGISIPAIIYRLVDAKIIAKEKHTSFYKKMNFDHKLKKLVNESRFKTPECSNRYNQLVYRALAQNNISLSKASSLLNKDLNSIMGSGLLI
jgi:Zn-dependent peptidase ImmA (M78 family)